MKQITQNYKSGELSLKDVPVPVLKPGGIIVRNRYSLVSVGTEKSMTELAQKGVIGKAKDRPDLVRQVIDKAKRDGIVNTFNTVREKLDIVKPLGYSSAGVVVEVGNDVDEFLPNDRVACAGAGYASHAEMIYVPKNLCAKIPENVSFADAACTTVGAVAMQGVREADLSLGERVMVIGLGIVGQITGQLLSAAGCTTLGYDPDITRVKSAEKAGLEYGFSEINDLEKATDTISKGYGIDAVIITASTKSSEPVNLAARIARHKGRIVVVGNIGMELHRDIFYKKELDLRLSRSYGPGRYDPVYEEKGIDYPFGYVRWTENRNMETVLDLISKGKLVLDKILTHCFPIDEAENVYKLLNNKISSADSLIRRYKIPLTSEDKDNDKLLGILIEYKESVPDTVRLKANNKKELNSNPELINVGLIGAGNFAKNTLIPILNSIPTVQLKGLASSTGINAVTNREKYHFQYCTTDYNEILNDNEIDSIIIATRHNLHVKLVIEGLRKGKDIFVEKPLALNKNELTDISDTWNVGTQRLMVGFNRRFSSHVSNIMKHFKDRREPFVINYRINAGFIPMDSWVHDAEEGGGRIIGEVCHFVDLLQFITGSPPVKIYADLMLNSKYSNDNVTVNLKFKDGSIGTITYLSCGEKVFPKERLEIFNGGSTAVIDDFRSSTMIKSGKTRIVKTRLQDKGHLLELKTFFSRVKEGKDSPIPFRESFTATLATFRIVESIKKGIPIIIDNCELTC